MGEISDLDRLAEAINSMWPEGYPYHAVGVDDLVKRCKNLGEERTIAAANFSNMNREYVKLDARLRALSAEPATPEQCPLCKGTGKTLVTSFLDSSKQVERSCHICKGRGVLVAEQPAKGAVVRAEARADHNGWVVRIGRELIGHWTVANPEQLAKCYAARVNAQLDGGVLGFGCDKEARKVTEHACHEWCGSESCVMSLRSGLAAPTNGRQS